MILPDTVPEEAQDNAVSVLIVDDHDAVREALRDWIVASCTDVKIYEARAGEDALRLAERTAVDIVMMDIGLPGISGYDAARKIRGASRGESGANAPLIVALTGWGQEQDRRRSVDAGIDHHLVKPLDLEKLRRILAAAPPPGAG